MMTNNEWVERIGFVPAKDVKNATRWGVEVAKYYYLRSGLSRAGLQKLLIIPPKGTPCEVWTIFNRLGEQAPRIINLWVREEDPDTDDHLYQYMYRVEDWRSPIQYEPGPLPHRRWRTVKEYASFLDLEYKLFLENRKKEREKLFYSPPPPLEGVEYQNSPASLAAAAHQFRNCAASYEAAIRSGEERIAVVENRIMVRYNPKNNLLLEAKYTCNQTISDADMVLVKTVLGLH